MFSKLTTKPSSRAANLPVASRGRNDTVKIAMDARPGGPAAKRQPSPEGLGNRSEDDPSAGGAALNRSSALPVSLGAYPDFLLAALERAVCAVFCKENRMEFAT